MTHEDDRFRIPEEYLRMPASERKQIEERELRRMQEASGRIRPETGN